ncbi:uncharacterized protein LOC132708990 [Pantherophis guttatus]|uniref:Uncharacterized protein LOC132708990 n=1 Tax=Pantherophis guttatus TaxID=94885 RepID=A0ABM3YMW7_PANGU|nr:uncharacterized protein LOC132708990 [Pantherophis guttatus]
MIKEVNKGGLLKTAKTKAEYKKEVIEQRAENWKSKALHGQYLKSIEGKADQKLTWNWLRSGVLKKETESFILAAQEQALATNCMKAKIQHVTTNSKCRLCNEKDETVDYLISGCSKISQTDYLQRHDSVAKIIHWKLCQKFGFEYSKNHWEHQVEKVLENEKLKILWDFRIQTDRHLVHNTPDITIVEKKKVWFIDIAIPGDAQIEDKQQEKITKYRDLQIEVE